MKSENIETYEPKKRFLERIKPLFKPGLRIFIIFAIVILTMSATKYALERNYAEDIVSKVSSPIIGNVIFQNNVQNQDSVQNKAPTSAKKTTDYSTLVSDLLKSDIVQDLPNDAVLRLQFYNFDSGVREWEKSYNLKKNSVQEGSDTGNIQIIMHSKYVQDFKIKSVCEVLTSAKNNGDFGVDTEMSDSALVWKYKSMMKYRSCLGF